MVAIVSAGLLAVAAQPKILVEGHRGARAIYPENTIPAFEYAIRIGADVLELDLHVTKDNVLVVSHDAALNPKICRGPAGSRVIRELTLSEVQRFDCGAIQNPDFPKQKTVPGTPPPTFDEVLDLAGQGRFEYNVEIKINPRKPELAPPPAEFARLVVDAVRKHELSSRVIIQSFDFRALHAVHRIAPELRLSALYGRGGEDFVSIAHRAGAGIVSPNFHLVTAAKVKAAHAAGLRVVPWTPDTPADWKKLVEDGVDGIITDNPAALIQYLKQRGLR